MNQSEKFKTTSIRKQGRKQKHQRLVTQFGPIWHTLGERAPLQSTKMKVIQMSYKKLAKELTKNKT